jgi:GT2 family glycosyltransferase
VVTVPRVDGTGGPTTVCSAYPTPLSHLASGYRLGRWFSRGSRARSFVSRALGAWGRAQDETLHSPVGTWPLSERWVSGALLSVAATRIRAIGGFDDSYFLYYEDVDLSSRLAAAHPTMRAVVADVEAGVHAVGGTAAGESSRVERIRLDSAIRWASRQPGFGWSACAVLLRLRTRFAR